MPTRLTILTLLLVALPALAGATQAAFTATTETGVNAFSAAADWTAPTASASVVGRGDGSSGPIRPGESYRVYASVTDTGNPASGTATVTADVSTLTAGATAATLTAGAWSFGGTAYTHRSALLTAGAGLAAGTYAYTLTLTDTAGNTRTQSGLSVQVAEPPAFRAATSAATDSGQTVTVAAPAAQPGDVLFAVVVTNANPAVITAPAGWVVLETRGMSGIEATVFRKTAGAEPASYAFTSNAGNTMAAGILAYRDVVDSDQRAGMTETAVVATHLTPSLTTTVNSRLLAIYADSLLSGGRSWTSADTERVDLSTAGGGTNVSMAAYDTGFLGPGTHQRSATSTDASKNAATFLIALK